MSYSQINTLYGIFKHNKEKKQLDEDKKQMANWMLDGYLSLKDWSTLTDKEVFQLSVAAFYQEKITRPLVLEFANRFSQGFDSVRTLTQENLFITLYLIERSLAFSNDATQNKALTKSFYQYQSYDELVNFFQDKESNNALLGAIIYKNIKSAKNKEDSTLVINMYRNSPLSFWTGIFEHYGLDAKTEMGSNVWLIAANYQRVDLLKWLEKQNVPYERVREETPFSYMMKEFYIYSDEYLKMYDFLLKKDKANIPEYEKDHESIMAKFIKHGNIKGMDYLIKNNFDFSKPSFSYYLEQCDNYTGLFLQTEEETTKEQKYIKNLRQDIIQKEREVLLNSGENLAENTNPAKKIKI